MALWLLEGLLPINHVIPGAKLGLANVVILIIVLRFGLKEALMINLLRCFIISLFTGTTFGFTFVLSLGGGICAALAMGAIGRWGMKHVSVIGLSIAGAFAHNIAQVILACIMLGHRGILVYLPYFLVFSLPTGFFTGLVTHYVLQATGWQDVFQSERGGEKSA